MSQNATPKIKASQKTKEVSLVEKMMELFALIFESLTGNSKLENVVEEALMCMITFASQNLRFKNAFISQINLSAKKGTVLKLAIERLMA